MIEVENLNRVLAPFQLIREFEFILKTGRRSKPLFLMPIVLDIGCTAD